MNPDVQLEKFLDVMIEQAEAQLGKNAQLCPLHQWWQEVLLEIRSENNTTLMTELPNPTLNCKICVKRK